MPGLDDHEFWASLAAAKGETEFELDVRKRIYQRGQMHEFPRIRYKPDEKRPQQTVVNEGKKAWDEFIQVANPFSLAIVGVAFLDYEGKINNDDDYLAGQLS